MLDALKHKVRYGKPSSFVMLVAERAAVQPDGIAVPESEEEGDAGAMPVSASAMASTAGTSGGVVGVVEVSVASDPGVLKELRSQQRIDARTFSYAYVASMAVASSERRMGLATQLLACAQAQALVWREQHMALYVYQDNSAAVRGGNRVVPREASQPFTRTARGEDAWRPLQFVCVG